jgi:(p)ppGpp synthase/HD superfamily hydrolase
MAESHLDTRSRASTRQKESKKQLLSGTNLPRWLDEKLAGVLDKAATKESFFARIGEIWPCLSKQYLLIERAYDAMERSFRNKMRDNGDQYFEHLRVSALIAIVHMRVRNANIICAILMHDCIEDCPDEWNFNRIAAEFNRKIANLVWWVTKPVANGNNETSDDIDRRYHRRLSKAPRKALCVKLPERLHNIITIWGQDEARIRRKLSETKDFILPLAEKYHMLVHEFEDTMGIVERRLAA